MESDHWLRYAYSILKQGGVPLTERKDEQKVIPDPLLWKCNFLVRYR